MADMHSGRPLAGAPANETGDQFRHQRDRSAEVRQSAAPWWGSNGWRESVEWWSNPRLAYAAGLADGVELERRRREPEDHLAHRQAVERLVRLVDVVDRRERADRGEVAA